MKGRLPLAAGVAGLLSTASLCAGPAASKVDQAAQKVAAGFTLDRKLAQSDLAELTREPHPFGSVRQQQVIDWLRKRMGGDGVPVKAQPFTAEVPNPAALNATGPVATTLQKRGTNLYGEGTPAGPCVVALATHDDTKVVEGTAYLGANDGGSSTAVLLQQLAYLRRLGPRPADSCAIVGMFLDGEEAVLANWSDGERLHPAHLEDHTYGSRFAASQLTACTFKGKAAKCLPASLGGGPLVGVVLMDMIGSPDLRITREGNSDPQLVELAAKAAEALGAPEAYDRTAHGIEDDHIPFKAQGVPVLDLIDFNHLEYWHRPGDDPAMLSLPSMETAGRIALYVAAAQAASGG